MTSRGPCRCARSTSMGGRAATSTPRRASARGRASSSLVRRVVDGCRAADSNREAKAADGCVVWFGTQAVHEVGRDVDQVTRTDVTVFTVDGHQAASGLYEVELVCRV